MYDYCVDEPVGRVDPEGLEGESTVASGGFLSGIGDWFNGITKKIGGMFSPDEAQTETGNQASDAGQAAASNATEAAPSTAENGLPASTAGSQQNTNEPAPSPGPGIAVKAMKWLFGNPEPNSATVTKGAVKAGVEATEAVAAAQDAARKAGAQGVGSISPVTRATAKDVGRALNAADAINKAKASAELGDIAQQAITNATAIEKDINSGELKRIEDADRDRQEYFNVFGKGALRKGAKIAPTPVGPGPLKR